MATRYGSSKIFVTSASMLLFGGIAALVSLKGPYGNSATTSVAAATDQDDLSRVSRNEADDDRQYFNTTSDAPVARSRGS